MQKTIKALKLSKLNSGTSTGLKWLESKGEKLNSYSPVDGLLIASVYSTKAADYEKVVKQAQKAFAEWRMWTAPKRGEVVRQIGEQLRKYKEPLGKLVSYEMGKSLQEGYGEVQEMIDDAIRRHNRNASIISMCVGWVVLALFAEGLLRLVGAIPPLLPWLNITLK